MMGNIILLYGGQKDKNQLTKTISSPWYLTNLNKTPISDFCTMTTLYPHSPIQARLWKILSSTHPLLLLFRDLHPCLAGCLPSWVSPNCALPITILAGRGQGSTTHKTFKRKGNLAPKRHPTILGECGWLPQEPPHSTKLCRCWN
jgi:hypothetical protein